ncbi:hypothetical protein D3C72_575160 [compost metagenome]
MHLHHDLPHLGLLQQEGGELLGEDVVRGHRIPGLGAPLVLRVAWRRDLAEVALRHVADLVVVIEHHPAVAGHAEVLEQHVAGEDVGRRQLADGVAVLLQGEPGLLLVRLIQIEVQRDHLALCVEVLDHQLVGGDGERRGGHRLELGQQFGGDAVQRKLEVGELLGVGHAAHPVVLFHQPVFRLHLLVAHILGRGELVLDHLEHHIVGGEGEHAHHHPLDAGGDDELLPALGQVLLVVAIELGLAVLLAADGVVDLVVRLAGHDLAQEQHEQGRHRGIDHEVGAGEAEYDGGQFRLEDDGVHIDALAGAEQRQDEGMHLAFHPNEPHQIGPLVAVEHLLEQLDGERLLVQYGRAALRQMAMNVDDVPLLVLKGQGEAVIPEQLAQGLGQVGEVGAIDPQQSAQIRVFPPAAKGVDVEVLVADVAMAEDPAIDGVEEGLRHLEVVTAGQQIAEGPLHLLEQGLGRQLLPHHLLDEGRGGADMMIIEANTLAPGELHPQPVAVLEAALAALGYLEKAAVKRFETLQDRLGDRLFQWLLHLSLPCDVSGPWRLCR